MPPDFLLDTVYLIIYHCAELLLIRSLIYMIILPTTHEDLKLLFLKFAITRWRRVLKIGFCTVEAYLLLLAHTKFDSCILKNWQLIQHCMQACNNSARDVVKYCDDLCLCNINIFANDRSWWSTTVVNIFKPYCCK